jgi:hypothetical protein
MDLHTTPLPINRFVPPPVFYLSLLTCPVFSSPTSNISSFSSYPASVNFSSQSISHIIKMSGTEAEGHSSFRSLAELPRQADPANAQIRPEVYRQWTFVAEIVAVASSSHYDTALVVRDDDEQVLTVGFDLAVDDGIKDLARNTFKTGCTLLILNAHKVDIRGGRNVTGIEVKDIGHIKVSSSSLFFDLCPAREEPC